MNKITVAIDGTSSTGKSTLAKLIAKELEYVYVDTGAMYRAVTYFALQSGFIVSGHLNEEVFAPQLEQIHISFVYNPEKEFSEVYLNGENIESQIRTMEVSNNVSQVASLSAVRQKLVSQQKQMGKNKGVVMDGRDIGTVVFPDAEVKLFITADAPTRAQRRYLELQEKGLSASYDEVLKNILERDQLDTQRKDSPLIKAIDAIEIDNSILTKQQFFESALQIVKAKLV